MEETEIREAVNNMNMLLSDEMQEQHSFWFQSNDFIDVVLFDGVVLWESENDDREWIDGEDQQEDLTVYLKREFEKYAKRVASVSLVPKLQGKLQHLYNDITMLKNGEWSPDEHSCNETLENIEGIADELNIDLEYLDDEE